MARRPETLVVPNGPTEQANHDSLHEQIAALAHALWHERGCPEGSPDVDWLAAERQLKQPDSPETFEAASEWGF